MSVSCLLESKNARNIIVFNPIKNYYHITTPRFMYPQIKIERCSNSLLTN